ncbi:MAG TPA: non-canonical purine NTP pyrophosphatase [Opitutaceae bacterium]|nr:non-canonical purine NTP pyrophosphatase [Opitutaceae bacterium]
MKLFLASGNAHKAEEFSAFAKASAAAEAVPIEIISAIAVGGMPAVVEDTGTFAGNARKKALALRTRLPADAWALADDSGLCVDALGDAPGVESAYYAGPHSDSAANLKKLTETMRGVPDPQRGAHFICVLMLAGPAGEFVFEGRCDGRLLSEPRGGSGFGYDPLFVPEGYGQSFSELGAEIKNRLSHRVRAWEKLSEWLRRSLTVNER